MANFFNEKIKNPVMDLLKSGVSAEKLALSLAFGVTCGVFPIPGITTVPVILATFLFRLNPVAPMLVNYISTPLNIATVPVFIHYGNMFFGSSDSSISVSAMMEGLKTDTISTLSKFQYVLLNGILAWLLFLPFGTVFIYIAILPFLRSSMRRIQYSQTKKAD